MWDTDYFYNFRDVLSSRTNSHFVMPHLSSSDALIKWVLGCVILLVVLSWEFAQPCVYLLEHIYYSLYLIL